MARSPNSKPSVVQHNSATISRGLTDEYVFSVWGSSTNLSLLALVGGNWYATDSVGLDPGGKVALGNDSPDFLTGYSTNDAVWHLFDIDGLANGFTNTLVGTGVALVAGDITNTGVLLDTGNSYVKTSAVTVIPEPSSIALLGLGGLALLLRRRK